MRRPSPPDTKTGRVATVKAPLPARPSHIAQSRKTRPICSLVVSVVVVLGGEGIGPIDDGAVLADGLRIELRVPLLEARQDVLLEGFALVLLQLKHLRAVHAHERAAVGHDVPRQVVLVVLVSNASHDARIKQARHNYWLFDRSKSSVQHVVGKQVVDVKLLRDQLILGPPSDVKHSSPALFSPTLGRSPVPSR